MPVGSDTPGAATQRGGFWIGLERILGRFWVRFGISLASRGALLNFFLRLSIWTGVGAFDLASVTRKKKK